MRRNFVQDYLNEAVNYGGIPIKRGDLYKFHIDHGTPPKQADSIAFGYVERTNAEPWPLIEFEAWMAERHPVASKGE